MDVVTEQAAKEVTVKRKRGPNKRHDPLDQTDERVRRAHGRSPAGGVAAGRHDPKARHISGQALGRDGTPRFLLLVNKDPNRTYALPFKGGDRTEYVSYLESLGYEIETYKQGKGVRLGAGKTSRTVGSPIEFRGHVLMSVDNETAEDIRVNGPDGISGARLMQKRADDIRGKRGHTEAFKARRDISSYAYEDVSDTKAEKF